MSKHSKLVHPWSYLIIVVTFEATYATETNGAPFRSVSRLDSLNLFSAPACIVGLAHIAGWLDRGDEFEGDETDTDNANDTTSNVAEDSSAEKEATK